MPPFLLRQKIPVLVSISNVLVSICNLSVTYFFPMWFETVKLSTASSAGQFLRVLSSLSDISIQRCPCCAEQCSHVRRVSVCWVCAYVIKRAFSYIVFRWIMHRTGKYKTLNLIFGLFPTLATILIATLNEGSPEWLQWLSIVRFSVYQLHQPSHIQQIPLGFGASVVLQTTLIALLASVDSE